MHEGAYDPHPWYPLTTGRVTNGHGELAAQVRSGVLALDGPAAFDWSSFVDGLRRALDARGLRHTVLDVRDHHPDWAEVRCRTSASDLPGDPDFARLARGKLSELFDDLPQNVGPTDADVLVVYGPGAALVGHDEVWLVDLPKRHTLLAVQQERAANLGQPADQPGSAPRHLFVDWPLLDQHRNGLLGEFSRFVDATDPVSPTSAAGDDVRATMAASSRRPLRTLPTFLPGAWGGQWLRRHAGVEPDQPNIALGYELIAPEATVVLRSADAQGIADPGIEVPFELFVEADPTGVLGAPVTEQFGTSFPLRFDYLDTVEGGNLSIHCHPVERYMREIFGWDYTQHESYYVMAAGDDTEVFLGLRADTDIASFHADVRSAVEEGTPFDVREYVQAHPAEQHQLYLIPAGTPHASGVDNLVLEISATPYLYSLRFFDWLRRDLGGNLRPVHIDHAFANLDTRRRGEAVPADLVPTPEVVRFGAGWSEQVLSSLPDVFFEVRRLDFTDEVTDDTGDRFHLLNLVEGTEAVIETATGHSQRLAYAETLVVPAAVGRYRLRRTAGGPCRVVKALVR